MLLVNFLVVATVFAQAYAILGVFEDGGVFDFIIVGAGSAGSVIANRLSANGTYKVLLLEAGGEPSPLKEVPGLTFLMYYTRNNWHYKMEHQEGIGSGLIDNRVFWNAGKGLGGTSLINYMMHVRGHRADYDEWAKLGNPGWSYEEVLPYFKKSENVHLSNYDPKYRSVGGELDVGLNNYRFPFADEFVSACESLDLGPVEDYNAGKPFGGNYLQSTERDGSRCDAEKAFIRPARKRKNLTIRTHALVTKVIINPTTKEAEGVEYERFFKKQKAYARREVIVSAGALRSPQILMLSGIGPKDHLKEFDIHVIKDLPVGKLLYDHPTFFSLFFYLNDSSLVPRTLDALNPINIGKYLIKKEGPYTIPSLVVESVVFISTNETNGRPEVPNVELIQLSSGPTLDQGLLFRREFGISADTYKRFYQPYALKPTFSILPMLYHPESKGYVKLRSASMQDPLKFYANYFTDPKGIDMKRMLSAVRTAQKICKKLGKFGCTQVMRPLQGCEKYVPDSDDFWECQVRSLTMSLWHQVATCKMGPTDDPGAVVDNKLRVYGIKKLRVADAGVIPTPLSVHTNIPAFMIGEKASDIILAAHK